MSAAELARRLDAWAVDQGRKDLGGLTGVKSIAIAETNPAGRPVSFRIADANGRKVLWESEDLRYAVNAGAAGSKDTLKSGFVTPSLSGGRVTFDGRGHGHGAGMCQFGAEAMSKAGRDHRDILRRYYPGAIVQVAPADARAAVPAAAGL
jgi:stage II sporulation protein D